MLRSCYLTHSILLEDKGNSRPVNEPVGTENRDLYRIHNIILSKISVVSSSKESQGLLVSTFYIRFLVIPYMKKQARSTVEIIEA